MPCRGYYRTLPSAVRIEQIKRMIDLIENLYPRMRVYVYDARMIYSSPMTVLAHNSRCCIWAKTIWPFATANGSKDFQTTLIASCARRGSHRANWAQFWRNFCRLNRALDALCGPRLDRPNTLGLTQHLHRQGCVPTDPSWSPQKSRNT